MRLRLRQLRQLPARVAEIRPVRRVRRIERRRLLERRRGLPGTARFGVQQTEAVQRRGIASLERERGLLGLEGFGDVARRASGDRQIVKEARVPNARHRLSIHRDGFRRPSRVLQRAPIGRLEHRRVGKLAGERLRAPASRLAAARR